MADNVTIPASGTGDATPKVATEQVATTNEHKQLVELAIPGTGRTLVPADAANGLDVDVTRVGGTVTVSGTVGVSGAVDTELPAAAALADNMANPTVPQVGSHAMVWDAAGANWDRESQPLTDTQLRASAVPVSAAQSGTWTVQPGNTANTTPWLVTGDVDHDAANTLKNVQFAGHASAVDVPPANVSAVGDRVRAWMNRAGAQVVRRAKISTSYTATYRLAEAAARLDQTFTHVANTNKQWATLHHTAAATKEMRLQLVIAWITSAITVAPQGIIELRELSSATAPATGNPAITPRPHKIGAGASEAVALYLPTTAGSEAAANGPLGHHVFDEGVSVATTAFAHPQGFQRGGIVLFDSSQLDDEVMPPTAPVGTYGGWAVVTRLTGATVMRMTVMMVFTEEIP